MLGTDWVGIITALGTLLAAVAGVIAAFKATAANNNTQTPGNVEKTIGQLLPEVVDLMKNHVQPVTPPAPTPPTPTDPTTKG